MPSLLKNPLKALFIVPFTRAFWDELVYATGVYYLIGMSLTLCQPQWGNAFYSIGYPSMIIVAYGFRVRAEGEKLDALDKNLQRK
jgi:hypothetical protein